MIRDIFNILYRNRIISALSILILVTGQAVNAQADKKYLRQGNRSFEKSKFADSEISYRKATDKNKNNPDAVFNTGDALYKQNKFEEAGKQFLENASMNEDPMKKSAALYNLGNSLLKSNKLEESIESYKGSLKMNPESPEAKYNLAYAQDLLKKQKEQQQQQQNKDKQDQKKDQNKKDQKDPKNDNKDEQKNQDQQQQQEQQGMSKDDAERLLNALANEEKDVQEKVKLAKASKERVRTVKNW